MGMKKRKWGKVIATVCMCTILFASNLGKYSKSAVCCTDQ